MVPQSSPWLFQVSSGHRIIHDLDDLEAAPISGNPHMTESIPFHPHDMLNLRYLVTSTCYH